ncbi:DNA transporter [Streptomyces sp. NPDC048489]|uniref:DNA transporter n=1 Tax=Streptomyces sp. NPDC048489 TaxID=3154504 RepID=UPI00341CF603
MRLPADRAFTHGGYNGLMEAAARGAARHGVSVTAVTLAERSDWGAFNPYVTAAVYAPTMGERLHAYLDDADLVVAVGTLHELAAALYYATTIRPLPVRLLGPTACRLGASLRAEGWLTESPTRPLGFLRELPDAEALADDLNTLAARRCTR